MISRSKDSLVRRRNAISNPFSDLRFFMKFVFLQFMVFEIVAMVSRGETPPTVHHNSLYKSLLGTPQVGQ